MSIHQTWCLLDSYGVPLATGTLAAVLDRLWLDTTSPEVTRTDENSYRIHIDGEGSYTVVRVEQAAT